MDGGRFPRTRRLEVGGRRVLLVHGSPRKINEFLWETHVARSLSWRNCWRTPRRTCSSARTRASTGSGELPSGRLVVNAGVLGRPANDGRTNVWYARLTFGRDGRASSSCRSSYDHEALARRDGGGDAPARVRRDDPDRLVDDVPRDPAGQGAGAREVLTGEAEEASIGRCSIVRAAPARSASTSSGGRGPSEANPARSLGGRRGRNLRASVSVTFAATPGRRGEPRGSQER